MNNKIYCLLKKGDHDTGAESFATRESAQKSMDFYVNGVLSQNSYLTKEYDKDCITLLNNDFFQQYRFIALDKPQNRFQEILNQISIEIELAAAGVFQFINMQENPNCIFDHLNNNISKILAPFVKPNDSNGKTIYYLFKKGDFEDSCTPFQEKEDALSAMNEFVDTLLAYGESLRLGLSIEERYDDAVYIDSCEDYHQTAEVHEFIRPVTMKDELLVRFAREQTMAIIGATQFLHGLDEYFNVRNDSIIIDEHLEEMRKLIKQLITIDESWLLGY